MLISARAGDVIFFSYYTIHWSNVNRIDQWRRSVRFGFHNSEMCPVGKEPEEPYNNIIVAGFKENTPA